jgi:transposase
VVSSLSEKRTRGPNKQSPWSRDPEAGLSVLRLALDTTDSIQRARVERMFSGAYAVRRALQRGARDRATAYWAAVHERARDPAAVRARLGLSRQGFEHAAYGHVDGAPHLRSWVTKALAMHLADSVWTGTERHLFRDASGKTQGMPRVGRWYDFVRLPGRARSHTTERKWETFRLHGTLDGHRTTYTRSNGRFAQPHSMRRIEPNGSWWSYAGPLAVVFSGLPGGTVVLPVRLPTAASNQPILDHHLKDAASWHKIDLVRRRDPNAAGGWRYEAHLMVLTARYVSPATQARRAAAAIATNGRSAGIDVNVSNITIASHDHGRDLTMTRIERESDERERDRSRAKRERRRKRALERSRRAMNSDRYQLSKRQAKRARRREAAGLRPQRVIPSGPRDVRSDGRPLQTHRTDQLSASYRRGRAAQAAADASATQARRDHARRVAGALVAQHGFQLVVEDCNISVWSRRWGRSLLAFAPSTLLSAIDDEATTVARIAGTVGGVLRAATQTTALSQHCLCGRRVAKSLGDRTHRCSSCELVGDRDAVAAVLAAHVAFGNRDEPASATVDFDAARGSLADPHTYAALRDTLPSRSFVGRQDVPSESTAYSARDGSFVTWTVRTPDPVVVARRIVGVAPRSTPDETSIQCWTTLERSRTRTNLPRGCGQLQLRDSS